jgi:hypothetical protein
LVALGLVEVRIEVAQQIPLEEAEIRQVKQFLIEGHVVKLCFGQEESRVVYCYYNQKTEVNTL